MAQLMSDLLHTQDSRIVQLYHCWSTEYLAALVELATSTCVTTAVVSVQRQPHAPEKFLLILALCCRRLAVYAQGARGRPLEPAARYGSIQVNVEIEATQLRGTVSRSQVLVGRGSVATPVRRAMARLRTRQCEPLATPPKSCTRHTAAVEPCATGLWP